MSYAFLDHPGPLALAHRGGWPAEASSADGSPAPAARDNPLENTAAAFQHAVDLGFRYLETDVHATADGALLAFHDPRLDRTTDRSGAIAELPFAEVARARVGGSEPIPLLEDLLGAWPQARFNIDVKDERGVAPLLRVLRRTGAWDRVCVGSFRQATVEAVRRGAERPLCLSAGPVDVARLRVGSFAAALHWLARRGVACAQVPLSFRGFPVLTRDFIAAAHRAGMQVHVWTINDPVVMHRLLDAGVDGLVSDDLTALRAVLRRRGDWHPCPTPADRPGDQA